MATPFMSLNLPTVSLTIGPTWATQINAAITTIDSHTHVAGQGQLIPSAGIGINADLGFANFNLTTIRTSRYFNQSAPLALPTDINCLFVSGGELWFNNQAGVPLQLTQNGSLNVSSIGGITGLGGTTGGVTYVAGTGTFIFTQAPNQSGSLDAGNITLRNPIGLGNPGITLQAGAPAAGYALTLPTGLPGSTSFLTASVTGQLGYTALLGILTTANLSASAGILGSQIAALTITGSNIAASTITGGKIAGQTVAASNIVNNTITRNQLAAVGQNVSTSSGVYIVTPTPTTILSVSLTTTGRPVMLMMQPDGVAAASVSPSTVTSTTVLITFLVDGTERGRYAYNNAGGTKGFGMMLLATGLSAATHTFTVQAFNDSGSNGGSVSNYVLMAYEL